jgi:four-jointed box protein 1
MNVSFLIYTLIGCLVTVSVECAPLNQSTSIDPLEAPSSIDQLLQDKIFWSPAALSLLPSGYDDQHTNRWVDQLRKSSLQQIKSGCGRQPNRLVRLVSTEDNVTGTVDSCFRYRHNYDQLQGELFSFLLGRTLDMRNFPPTAILQLNRLPATEEANDSMQDAKWNPSNLAVATQFLTNLTQARLLPALMVFSNRSQLNSPTHEPVISPAYLQRMLNTDSSSAASSFKSNLLEVMQWSDLIVFDYLIGNLDRLVNNLSNMRWNPDMLQAPVHNLYRRPDGLLVFLDQESGLLHGYRMLPTYERMHRQVLQQLCLFNPVTVSRLQQLVDRVQLREELVQRLNTVSLADQVDFLPEASLRTLCRRISKVLTQVHRCTKLPNSLYSTKSA